MTIQQKIELLETALSDNNNVMVVMRSGILTALVGMGEDQLDTLISLLQIGE